MVETTMLGRSTKESPHTRSSPVGDPPMLKSVGALSIVEEKRRNEIRVAWLSVHPKSLLFTSLYRRPSKFVVA